MFLPILTINSMTKDEELFIFTFSELSAYIHFLAPDSLPFPCS